jgi:galactokinase
MAQPGFQPQHVETRKRFHAHFGRPAAVAGSAPGRVNLLGEHTDYNGGFVLPTAIPQRTTAALAPRLDRRVVVCSRSLGEERGYVLGEERRTGGWVDYVQGVTASAARCAFPLAGFDAYVDSNVPLGSGLSSSAALEVALLRALREMFDWTLSDVELARIAVWGENNVVGAPVGILDPMACVLASSGCALFLDTRSLEHRQLPLPAELELVVIDSGVRHQLAGGEYGARRLECAEAAKALAVGELRDLSDEDRARIDALPPPLDRRARHVVSENARVLQAVSALERGDTATLGALFNASHASMRDDFAVSIPEIDAIVERALEQDAVYGARLTGGGFGGSVVCLVRSGHGSAVGAALARDGARVLLPVSAMVNMGGRR